MSESNPISIVFQSSIAPFYLRNNRSTGQKSMRCFPSCCENGHMNESKCGVPLEILAILNRSSRKEADIIFVAEIRPVGEPRLCNVNIIQKGILLDQIRNKGSNSGELFLGEANELSTTKDKRTMNVAFNHQLLSWDYSWTGGRWRSSNTLHVVDIIVLQSISYLEFKVMSSQSSTPFKIHCSKKRPLEKITISEPANTPILRGTLFYDEKLPFVVKRECFDYDVQLHLESLLTRAKNQPLLDYEYSDSEDDHMESKLRGPKNSIGDFNEEFVDLPKCR